MNKINLKGITSEAVTNVLILVVALVNAILQMFGINTLPIESEEISAIISGVFLVGMALWNTWKNRNITSASQTAQQVTDMIKNGELLAEDVQALISKVKKQEGYGAHK
jgi:SPP1 family holin